MPSEKSPRLTVCYQIYAFIIFLLMFDKKLKIKKKIYLYLHIIVKFQ